MAEAPAQDRTAAARPGSLALLAGLVLLAAAAVPALWNAAGNSFPGSLSDSTFYLYMADHLSDFGTRETSASTVLFSHQVFPPLFPAVLGLAGGGSEAVPTAHLAVRGIFLIALVLTTAWLWSRLGCWPALALAAATALGPSGLWLSNQILSEGLFMGLLYLALWLQPRSRDGGQYLLLGLVVAAVVLTRSVGALLVAAMVVELLVRDRRAIAWFLPAALLPVVAWHAFKRITYPVEAGYLEVFAATVGDASLADYLAGIGTNLAEMFHAIGFAAGLGLVTAVPLTLLAVLGVIDGLRRVQTPALFLAAYVALIIAWPFPAEMLRFEFVIHPLLLYFAVRGVGRLRLPTRSTGATSIVTVLIVAAALVSGVRHAARLMASVPPRLVDLRITSDWYFGADRSVALDQIRATRSVIDFIRTLPDVLPRGACLYTIVPHLVFHYTKLPTAAFPEDGAVSELDRCDYALAVSLNTVQSTLPAFHPYDALERPVVVAASEPDARGRFAALLLDLRPEP